MYIHVLVRHCFGCVYIYISFHSINKLKLPRHALYNKHKLLARPKQTNSVPYFLTSYLHCDQLVLAAACWCLCFPNLTLLCIQDGFTALYAACHSGHTNVTATLMRAQASVNILTKVSREWPPKSTCDKLFSPNAVQHDSSDVCCQ